MSELPSLPPEAVDPLVWCLQHFARADEANAAIHCSPVRYSPITFRLAELLNGAGVAAPDALRVLEHRGQYPLDRGRIEADS